VTSKVRSQDIKIFIYRRKTQTGKMQKTFILVLIMIVALMVPESEESSRRRRRRSFRDEIKEDVRDEMIEDLKDEIERRLSMEEKAEMLQEILEDFDLENQEK